jgi:cytoskeleton protein RodZ
MEAARDNAGAEAHRTLGGVLAAARESQALSRSEVAQRLHMSPFQVEALERDDYQRLPRGTFLRGFVRNYAKVLGLAPDDVLSLLAENVPRENAPGIVVPTQNIRFDPIGERLSSPYVKAGTLAVVAVSLAFAAMYWTMYVRPAASGAMRAGQRPAQQTLAQAPAVPPRSAPPGTPATVPPAIASPAAPPPSAPSSAAVPAAPAPRPTTAAIAPSLAAAGTAGAAARPVPGAKVVQFRFQGTSWVEVRDARGKLIFQRLNSAGTQAQVAARPPLDVVVGNAPDVRVTYDGHDFPLEPHTNVAVARFTLE